MRISLVSLAPTAQSLGTSLGLSLATASARRKPFSPNQQLALLQNKKFVNQNEARQILLECKRRRKEGETELFSREMFRAVNETCDPPLALSVLSDLQSYGIALPRLHLLSTSDRYSLRTLLSKIVLPPITSSSSAPHRVSPTNLSTFLSLSDSWLPNDPYILLLALRGWDSRLGEDEGGELLRRREIEGKVMTARKGWFRREEGSEELEGNGWHSLTEKESETIVASVDELRRVNSTRQREGRVSEDLLSSWDAQPRPARKTFHLQRILRLVLPLRTRSTSSSTVSPLLLPHAEISTFLLPPTLHLYHSDPFISLFTMYLYSRAVDPDPFESEGRNNFSRFRRELEESLLGEDWHPDVARRTMDRVEGLEGGARWCLDEMLKEGLVRERERAAWEVCLNATR
ncbi:hypothetical protein BDY24DRAFT_411434 [Mrakia frigida]|uniref:uncharacterized protein n=1 Tax=Mrakia frigida TaxID=29902 RepID=UPI003FCC0E95